MLFDNVKSLCSQSGITVAQLEREIQVGNGSIQKWKKSYPGADRLLKVADYFNIPLDFLLSREPRISVESLTLAQSVEGLPTAKQRLVKQYIDVLQKE